MKIMISRTTKGVQICTFYFVFSFQSGQIVGSTYYFIRGIFIREFATARKKQSTATTITKTKINKWPLQCGSHIDGGGGWGH